MPCFFCERQYIIINYCFRLLITVASPNFAPMIKRVSVLTVLMLYLATALGFALNLHYCGNKISSVKLNAPLKQPGHNAMSCKMKCCKDKHLLVKVKDAHQAAPASILSKIFAIDLPRLPFEDYILSAQKALVEEFFDRGPPNAKADTAIYLRNCLFRL